MWKKASLTLCVVVYLSVVVAHADMVAYWPLDEGAGTSVGDRTGTWNGAVTGGLAWVEGVAGTALEFPGGDNYVDFGNVQIGFSMTLAYWCFNPEKAYERPIGQHSGDYTTDPGWVVLSRNEGEGGVWFRVHGADTAWNGGDIVITDNLPKTEWYHLAFTFDGASRELKGYLNSELKVSAICEEGRTIEGNKNDLRLGNVGTAEVFTGMLDDIAIWDAALTEEEILNVFLLGPEVIDPRQAGNPSPENETTDVPRDAILSWTSGMYAGAHDVYFGTSFEDVNDPSRADGVDVLVSQGQTATSYDADSSLDFEQTYYWRVDEVNATPDNTIFKGKVWSFTVEPLTYPIENVIATSNGVPQADAGPENVVNGSGLNANDQHSTANSDMWAASPVGDEPLYILFEFDRVYKLHELLVWNYNVQFELLLGFGVKDAAIEYSENAVDWTVLGDVELAQGTAQADYTANTTIDLQGVPAQYVRLTVNSGFGMTGQFGLSEVRFLYIPAHARAPQPADGATEVSVDAGLAWRAGRDAISHDLYFGKDTEALEPVGTPNTAAYDPGVLDLDVVYYWKVDETSDVIWEGDLWSFTTQAYLVVEDFESYDDEENRIYDTWLDGWVNDTGSTVGHLEAPFAERTIVRSGRQSMPLFYDNTDASTSEAELALTQDWTTSGVKTLTLYFQGTAGNSGLLYIKINGTKVPYPGDTGDIAGNDWLPWSIDLPTVGVDLSKVVSLVIGIEGAGATGVVYFDDIELHP